MKRMAKKGQSILEYTLVIAAVIAVLILVLFGNTGISMKQQIESTYGKASTAVTNTNADIGSHGVFQ